MRIEILGEGICAIGRLNETTSHAWVFWAENWYGGDGGDSSDPGDGSDPGDPGAPGDGDDDWNARMLVTFMEMLLTLMLKMVEISL